MAIFLGDICNNMKTMEDKEMDTTDQAIPAQNEAENSPETNP